MLRRILFRSPSRGLFATRDHYGSTLGARASDLHPSPARKLVRLIVWGCLVSLGLERCAPAGLREGFETPEVSWREAGGDARSQRLAQQRVSQGAHSGQACEFYAYDAQPGANTLYLMHPIGRAPLIPELRASVWVLSDRPETQLLLHVVFPRSIDPATRAPVSTLIAGPRYEQVGAWQELAMTDMPTLVARQARVLRSERHSEVDTREAYIDQVVLNVYSGGGRGRVWIDDLSVDGFVESQPPGVIATSASHSQAPAVERRTKAELAGTVLMLEGRPFFPRSIDYQGEPLTFLRDLGFNTIRFRDPPTVELLAEAGQLGLAVICPPPSFEHPETAGSQLPADLTAVTSSVVAWHVGNQLTSRQLDVTRRWAERLRRADGASPRPILCEPEADLRAYSRAVDVLLLRREPIGTSFELTDVRTWLRERQRLARPGTPCWATIQTQPARELSEQWRMLSGSRTGEVAIEPDQLRLLVYAALSSGMRGLCFDSHSPLTATDEPTRLRAMTLELVNHELRLIEPWLASGTVVGTVPGLLVNTNTVHVSSKLLKSQTKDLGKSGLFDPVQVQQGVIGIVLQIDRGQLLLPIWMAAGGQYVLGQSAGNGLAFVVPGVPDANEAHEITPAGLRPLRNQRVAGGMRVTLDEFGMTSMIVVSQDPVVLSGLQQRIAQHGRRATQLERDLVSREMQVVLDTDRQLTETGHACEVSAKLLAAAQSSLAQCDASLASGDYRNAYALARRTVRPLAILERAHWQTSTKDLATPAANPLAVTFVTLPEYWRFNNQIAQGRWGENRLPEGEFEDLDRMVWAGWRHFEHPQEGIKTEADLSAAAPKAGRYSLRLKAQAVDVRATAGIVETAPIWITSPPVDVRSGQWLKISGFVYAPVTVAGSLDGVLILDSLGGEALAERVGEAGSWRPFTMYRAVPNSGTVTVTIALTGLGEAWVDDLSIETWQPPGAPPEPMGPNARSAMNRLPRLR